MHFATSGFILNQDNTKVLMVYHKKLNTWVIPGGHLENDEYPADGAVREVLEETGVKATILNIGSKVKLTDSKKESQMATPFMMLSESIPEKGDKKAHVHMDFIFLGKADDKIPLIKQEAEVENVKWMTLNEVLECNTFDSVKEIARQTMDKGGVIPTFLIFS